MAQLDVDSLMSRLLNVGMAGGRLTTSVSEQELQQCCFVARQVFISQPYIYDMVSFAIYRPSLVLGFTTDELPLSWRLQYRNYMSHILQNNCFRYPESFLMLRGNHECPAINRVYGFYEECNRRYKSSRLWSSFQDTFNWMPLCGLIAGRILCMHGGLSPQLTAIDQLRNLPRPQDPPNPSMGIDLLWADPDQWVKGWQANTRGVSYVFGQDVVIDMCQKLNLDLIARAHQVVQDGYEFFASKKMVTIFSAPHYCGQFDNFAATMKVNEDLVCNFSMYKPTAKAARIAAGNG
ncbi:unnamed protein product [Angiostrongylus costaricensis]|uniref:Serine/threonine-protein phosphatase n=1 Tax=Angiostrongylus costaricensis TaxID=334426 RepID=A0A0R3PYE1_ANGCS|nr:unnamed protein product [Angiostrongylus costaricensis]